MKPEQSFGLQILGDVMAEFGDDWDDLSQEHRTNASEVTMDYGALVLRSTWGTDVSEEMAEVKAAVAQWTWVGEDVVRRAMIQAAKTGLEIGAKAAVEALTP